MSFSLQPMLNIATKAARLGGSIINRASLDVGAIKAQEKGVNDFFTEVDLSSERSIIETLLTAYPDHGILAEESGTEKGNPNSDYVWIIDPLDGTHNFMHGFPVYCISIALSIRNKVELGVIYDPTRNDLFTAIKGRGAYLNEKRIRVSKQTDLSRAMITTGFPAQRGNEHDHLFVMLGEVLKKCANMRRTGSAALDLAYVACGYTEGFYESGLKAWDMAAGSLLATESGALVGNFTGEGDFLYESEIITAPPKIYAQLVAILRRFSQFADPTQRLALSEYTQQIGAITKKIATLP